MATPANNAAVDIRSLLLMGKVLCSRVLAPCAVASANVKCAVVKLVPCSIEFAPQVRRNMQLVFQIEARWHKRSSLAKTKPRLRSSGGALINATIRRWGGMFNRLGRPRFQACNAS
jgi:hypothetical protein